MERLLLKNLHRPSNNILFAIVILITTVMTTSTVFSQQLSDALRVSRKGLNFNARALSLGNTYSTIGYDYTALLFNPATMAGQKKFSVTMSLNANAFQSTTNYGGNTVDFTTTSSTAGQAGMILPFRLDSTRSFVLGAGFTQSKDFNLGFKFAGINDGSNPSFVEVLAGANDPAARDLGLSFQNFDATGNYTGDQTTLGSGMYEEGFLLDEGGLVHFTFGASVEAVRNVYFGISGSYNTGPYTSDLELSAADSNDVYPAGIETVPGRPETDGFVRADYRVVREKQYSGWDIRFGIMYRLENFIGLSAAFKVPTEHTVTEDIFTFGQSQFAANNSIILTPSMSTSSYSFQPPTEMTVGAMVNLWIITATAEASYLDYSSAKITSGVGELPDRTEINLSLIHI